MIPQIAHRLIERYSEPGDLVVDPFCGSGTVLLEALTMRAHDGGCNEGPRRAVGSDVNRLALLIAQVKTTPIAMDVLASRCGRFLKEVGRALGSARKAPAPVDFENVGMWFKPRVVHDLSLVSQLIRKEPDFATRNFLSVCFSRNVLQVSNVYRSGDTFLKRLSERELRQYHPNVLAALTDSLSRGQAQVRELSMVLGTGRASVFRADARRLPLKDSSADLIVTSPPYGEEQNTIGYTRWSRLSSLWLGFGADTIKSGFLRSLGSRNGESLDTPSETLTAILQETAEVDERLARGAAAFARDYFAALGEICRVLRLGGFCAIVLGDRSLKRRRVPMGQVTVEMALALGFEEEKVYSRKLPTKSIPWTVAKGDTIAREHIIILRRGSRARAAPRKPR